MRPILITFAVVLFAVGVLPYVIRGTLRVTPSIVPRLRRYSWIVGGPILFGLLVGSAEWSIEQFIPEPPYHAVGIGAVAFALALVSFMWWARRVQQLKADKVGLNDDKRKLKCQRNAQVRASSYFVSLYLEKFLEACEKENLQDEEIMRRYNEKHSGKPVGIINSLDNCKVGDAKEREGLKTPETPQEIEKLASYLRDVGLSLR